MGASGCLTCATQCHPLCNFIRKISKTGKHVIADLLCANCDASQDQRTVVGWKYLKKPGVRSQKYKEGKYVIEEAMLVKLGWGTKE